MMSRKWGAALLAGVMMLTVAGTAMAAPGSTVPGAVYGDQQARGVNKPVAKIQEDLQKAGVKDVKADYYAAGSITVLLESGLMKPAADGSFRPEANVNGAEGIAVFAKVLGVASKTDDDATALVKMQEAGLADGTVTADKDMSRVEVARLLAKALGVEPKLVGSPAQYPFYDYESTSAEDRGILAALYELGIFKGYEDRTFRPDAILTKAQIAILIDRILGAAH